MTDDLPAARARKRTGHRVFHEGELEAQRLFDVVDLAHETSELVLDRIGVGARRLIESLPLFFLAAAAGNGRVLGCEVVSPLRDASGKALPLVHVVDSRTLVFALPGANPIDEQGVGAATWGAGLLFVDFLRHGARYRINGRARAAHATAAAAALWPVPCRIVEVVVDQAYPNCTQRVVRMEPLLR